MLLSYYYIKIRLSNYMWYNMFIVKQTETNATTQKILKFFLDQRIFAKRHGVAAGAATYTNKEGDTKQRYFRAGIIGGSDIFVWLPPNGRFLGVEVKTGKDKMRPEQVGFKRNIELMGGLYWEVKTFEDFKKQWEIYESRIR